MARVVAFRASLARSGNRILDSGSSNRVPSRIPSPFGRVRKCVVGEVDIFEIGADVEGEGFDLSHGTFFRVAEAVAPLVEAIGTVADFEFQGFARFHVKGERGSLVSAGERLRGVVDEHLEFVIHGAGAGKGKLKVTDSGLALELWN